MNEAWRRAELPEIARALAQRPGHETVRTLMSDILRHAFGAGYLDISHEVRLPEVRGRADTLFGATVFEFKRDLRIERPDVEARLPDYLKQRERDTHRRYLGIATDGATFLAFELRGDEMVELNRHETRPDQPDALLRWLEPALSDRDDLAPEPLVIQRELGRGSLTFARVSGVLADLWHRLASHPEVALKRDLWGSAASGGVRRARRRRRSFSPAHVPYDCRQNDCSTRSGCSGSGCVLDFVRRGPGRKRNPRRGGERLF